MDPGGEFAAFYGSTKNRCLRAVIAGGVTPNTVVAQGVRIVAVATPTVPVSRQPTPDGLQRSVDLDRGRLTVLYLDRTTTDLVHTSDVYLGVTGAEPPVSGTGQAVDVQVHAGELTRSDARSTLTWERRPGQWVTLKGSERYNTPAALLGLASTVADTPVELTTRVTVAPEGWVATSCKEIGSGGAALTVSDPSDAARALVVVLSPEPAGPVDVGRLEDPGAVSTVGVQGRSATLVQGARGWYLKASLAGGWFVLMAPSDLTAEQVVQVADSVGVSP